MSLPNLAGTQFRVLYREFLFRMVDFEALSARGDMSRLLGQVAAMLAALSAMFSGGAARYLIDRVPRRALLMGAWSEEHFLISTTMMVAGLITVLCWDSTFPDRRDVLVLAPLPVRVRTLFLAKMAALAMTLGLTVCAVNVFTGITWPFALVPEDAGIFSGVRSFAAYWIAMLAAATFLLCSVLTVQGFAAQFLSRRLFLRVSGFLQLSAFCLNLTVYFLEPLLATPRDFAAPENQRLLAWLPSYWFLGLFHELNGAMHPALQTLARRAEIGLLLAGFGAVAALLLSYFRTLRRIVEEPDITPGVRRKGWAPRWADSFEAAIVLFSARTLLRSRQHRVILAFYLGIGFAIALAFLKSPLQHGAAWRQVNTPMLIASVVMMCLAVLGVRVVFSLPFELRSNWTFRVTAVHAAPRYLAATRRSLLALAVVPVWTMAAALFLSIWPLWPAAIHLAVLGLLGLILADRALFGFHKIPFTCSFLPGKANVHIMAGAYGAVMLAITDFGVMGEREALGSKRGAAVMLLILGLAAVLARGRTAAMARSPEVALRFEETPPADIFALELHRDGAIST